MGQLPKFVYVCVRDDINNKQVWCTLDKHLAYQIKNKELQIADEDIIDIHKYPLLKSEKKIPNLQLPY